MDIYCIFAESNLIRNYIMSLFKCPHTHKVVTSKGEVIYKECGKCRVCRMKRSMILSTGLTNASKLYKHVIFFSLTYNNENLPLAYDFSENPLTSCSADFYLDTKRFAGRVAAKESKYIKFDASSVFCGVDLVPPRPVNHEEANVFGVLCKRDVQLFNKRLRRMIEYDKDRLFKTLFPWERSYKYFICGEYGPNTLRPHYHGLFFTNEDEVAEALEHYFTKAWTLCDNDPRRYDFQHVISSAAGYVSSYVNTYVNLPRLLQVELVRPFYIKSQHLGFSEDEEKKVFEEISNGVVERVTNELKPDGRLLPVHSKLPFEVVNRLFPKCIGYRDFNSDIGALLSMYSPVSCTKPREFFTLSRFRNLGRCYYDAEHLNSDGSVGAYKWRNIHCVRACSYVCDKYKITDIDYVTMLVLYYCKLNMLYLRDQYKELEEFTASLPLSKAVRYQHVFSDDSYSWLRERLPAFIPLFDDDLKLSAELFSENSLLPPDLWSVVHCPEFAYYFDSPSDLLSFYVLNPIYDRLELDVGRVRTTFDFTSTDYYSTKKLEIDDRYERQLMSKKINNSKYASILGKVQLE